MMNQELNGEVNTKKLHHKTMIAGAMATHCAHCAMLLTDAESQERSLGPVCSKRGYDEDPKDGDEIMAFVYLSPWPELIEFVTREYKPLGLRGLVNGLVRIAALNRKSSLHAACCNAIESLGYYKMASLLRESIAAIEIRQSKNSPDYVNVWVKRLYYKPGWGQALKLIDGTMRDPKGKGILVLVHGENACTTIDGQKIPNQKILWGFLRKFYDGEIVKTDKGTIKIGQKESETINNPQ